MSGVDIKEVRARCEAATPGPWRLVDSVGVRSTVRLIDANGAEIADLLTDPRDRNETDTFIAAARTDVPALLDEIEAARAVVDGMRRLLQAEAELMEVGHGSRLREGLAANKRYAISGALRTLGNYDALVSK